MSGKKLDEVLGTEVEGREELLKKFSSVEGLASSYRELEKKLGTMMNKPTSEEATLDLMKRLGAKDDPGDYITPAGVDPEVAEPLKKYAAAARLTPEQFARVANRAQVELQTKAEAADKEASAVRKEYGEGFDEAAARVAKVLQGLGDRSKDYDASDPKVFRLLDQLGKSTGAGKAATVAPLSTPPASDTFDPRALAAEARKILASDAFSKRDHAEHQVAREEYGKRAMKLLQKGFNGAYDPRLMPPEGMMASLGL